MNEVSMDSVGNQVRTYARSSTYEISCLTNMANVVKEMAAKGITVPTGQIFSIVDKSTEPGTKDTDRVKTIERSAQLVKLGYRPIPHMSARRYRDAAHLKAIVQALLDVGTDGFLLLAGDPRQPLGGFAEDALEVGGAVVDDRARHRQHHALGHRPRARRQQVLFDWHGDTIMRPPLLA